jgi:hypothetical protein
VHLRSPDYQGHGLNETDGLRRCEKLLSPNDLGTFK